MAHEIKFSEYDISGGDPNRIWFISDPHFDHYNIIEYADRPFFSVSEMNSFIMHGWNSCVRSDDLVFFLGDMSFGRGSRRARWWLERLNGRKVYLKGSHDKGIRPTSILPSVILVADVVILMTDLGQVCLVHEPSSIPTDWSGWAIHGHVHNLHPHISPIHKRVNVSVEVTGYRPCSLSEIRESIRNLM